MNEKGNNEVQRGGRVEREVQDKEWKGVCVGEGRVRKGAIFFFLSCKCCVDFHMQRKGFVTLPILMYLMNAAFRFSIVVYQHFAYKGKTNN